MRTQREATPAAGPTEAGPAVVSTHAGCDHKLKSQLQGTVAMALYSSNLLPDAGLPSRFPLRCAQPLQLHGQVAGRLTPHRVWLQFQHSRGEGSPGRQAGCNARRTAGPGCKEAPSSLPNRFLWLKASPLPRRVETCRAMLQPISLASMTQEGAWPK